MRLDRIPFTRQWWARMRRDCPQMFDSASALAAIQSCLDDPDYQENAR